MEFFELIENRYSVRAYKNEQIKKEELTKILEAARCAPTACNLQAFKVVVINTNGKKADLKKIYKRDWFSDAPIVLGIFSEPSKNWVRSDRKNYSDVDASIVMDHIILAATALGLGTCWIGAFDAKAAKEFAGLPKEYEPVAFTPLGYFDRTEPVKSRKPLDELVVYI